MACLLAFLLLLLLTPVAATAASPSCVDRRIGTHQLAGADNIDIGVKDGEALRWRLENGTSGKLTHAGQGRWISTLS